MSSKRRALRPIPKPVRAPAPEQLPPTGGHRVLILGDTAGTGFGTVTRDLARQMALRGMDPRIMSMNEEVSVELDPAWPRELRGRTVMLGLPDGWFGGNIKPEQGKAAAALVQKAMGVFQGLTIPGWVPESVLIIGDFASLQISPWPQLIPETIPTFNYTPVEGVGLPPAWAKLWSRIKPVAMTRFGAEQIAKVTGETPPMVYHGVDPDAFWQVSGHRPLTLRMPDGLLTLRSKAECRQFLGWPDNVTIMFRADRNMPRKAYPAMFRKLAPVLAKRSDVALFLHCRTLDEGGNLAHELSKYPDFIQARVGTTGMHDKHGGAPRELLMAMYNAADLYISTCAEGFGLTVAESLACGTPAVALAYSSLPEVVGPAGVLVDDFTLVDNIYSHYWAIPTGDGYTQAVQGLIDDPQERRRLGQLGPTHIAQFSWATAAEQFEAILTGAPAPEPKPIPVSRKMQALGLVEARA